MSVDEVPQKLTCRHCGGPRIVFQISKPTKNLVKLKMNCPTHKTVVVYRMPLALFEQTHGIIKDHVMLCRKCAQPVEIVSSRTAERITTIKIRCPTHGEGDRHINASLYNMMREITPAATAAEPTPEPVTGKINFCASCGARIEEAEAEFCHHCGASLELD